MKTIKTYKHHKIIQNPQRGSYELNKASSSCLDDKRYRLFLDIKSEKMWRHDTACGAHMTIMH